MKQLGNLLRTDYETESAFLMRDCRNIFPYRTEFTLRLPLTPNGMCAFCQQANGR